MNIRPDDTETDTRLPNYINISNPTGNIDISGSVASLATANFPVTITTSVDNTRCDIYGKNTATLLKQLLSTSNFLSSDVAAANGIYQAISTESANMSIAQASDSVTVTFSIFNGTLGSISLVTQTITISVVEYQVPI